MGTFVLWVALEAVRYLAILIDGLDVDDAAYHFCLVLARVRLINPALAMTALVSRGNTFFIGALVLESGPSPVADQWRRSRECTVVKRSMAREGY